MKRLFSRPTSRENLAYSLDEGLRFNIADGTADFGDDNVRRRVAADVVDKFLNLVGDMRNDLHGGAEVLAAALLVEDVPVNFTGRQIGVPVQVLIDEALVMSEVEVGLRAVLGHVDFAVLIRAHGARVDVDVRVELLCSDL